MKPSIAFLDTEKIKNEGSAYNPRLPASATLNMPAPLVSPSLYSGPPPPYSYPSSTASSITAYGGGGPPTESRLPADEDKEQPPPPPHRHSLPSIHEALATGPGPLSIPSLLSKPPPLSTPQPSQNISPTTVIPRSYPDAASRGAPHPFNPHSPSYYRPPDSSEPPPRPQYSPRTSIGLNPSRFSAVNTADDHYAPSQPSRSASSPTDAMRPMTHATQLQHSSPVYDRFPRPPPPPSGYPSLGSHATPYSYPSSSASIPSYQPPPLQPTHWRSNGVEIDRAEEVRRAAAKGSPPAGQAYGESVKRHLEDFDLETSLNEVGPADFEVKVMTDSFIDRRRQPRSVRFRFQIRYSRAPNAKIRPAPRFVAAHRRVRGDHGAANASD